MDAKDKKTLRTIGIVLASICLWALFLCIGGKLFRMWMIDRIVHPRKATVREIKDAWSFSEDLCRAGDSPSCLSLGYLYFYGQDELKKNVDLAKDYFGKACDLGLAKGDSGQCISAAMTLEADKSNAAAAAYFRKKAHELDKKSTNP